MRVLLIHNYYQHPGGEDVVFEQERQLLSTVASVTTLTFRNRTGWRGAWQTLWLPWNVFAGARLKKAIEASKPNVIHLHNLHYAIGPIAIRVAHRQGIPVVMTLHNYRLICPSATLFHQGNIFADSIHAAFPWKAVRLGVHAGSSVKTLWLALALWFHRKIGTWQLVDRYIALTDFARQLFAGSSFGVPAARFAVKPNFSDCRTGASAPRENYFLFIGRLTPEKGIDVLLDAFAGTALPLRIAGDGPLRPKVKETARQHPNIQYLGAIDRPAVMDLLSRCSALIFPSIWYEGMPMTLLEAFALGTPVIASNLGAMQAMIQDGRTGWLFPAGDGSALRRKAEQWLETDEDYRRRLAEEVRRTYETHYTPQRNLELLLQLYDTVRQPPGT